MSTSAVSNPFQRPHTEMLPFSDEDIPMTFQIGIVASDGVIIASDTKAGRWDQWKTTSHTTKVNCCPESGVVYCCSGSDVAIHAAGMAVDIAAQEPELSMKQCAEKAASAVWNHIATRRERRYEESVLLARATASSLELWKLTIADFSPAQLTRF